VITGGASGRITSALRVPFRIVPDLVLRGLAEIARRVDA
jgi:pantothenate kinase type III